MAAPYSHSLPQLTQEPVSSTSVNSADYSKMMEEKHEDCSLFLPIQGIFLLPSPALAHGALTGEYI